MLKDSQDFEGSERVAEEIFSEEKVGWESHAAKEVCEESVAVEDQVSFGEEVKKKDFLQKEWVVALVGVVFAKSS